MTRHPTRPIRIALRRMNVGQSILLDTDEQRRYALRIGWRDGFTVNTLKLHAIGYQIMKQSNKPAKRAVGKPTVRRKG